MIEMITQLVEVYDKLYVSGLFSEQGLIKPYI